MYRRLLVPIDGSPAAERGLDEALGLARAFDASLVLLHVIEVYPMLTEVAGSNVWEQLDAGLRDAGRGLLERAHRRAGDAGLASETHLVDAAASRVCDVIIEQAGRHHCDLIVMGTHGRRGLQHALIGSDAERVLRASPVPVLLVRAPQTQ